MSECQGKLGNQGLAAPGPRFISIFLNQRGLRPRTPVGDALKSGLRNPIGIMLISVKIRLHRTRYIFYRGLSPIMWGHGPPERVSIRAHEALSS